MRKSAAGRKLDGATYDAMPARVGGEGVSRARRLALMAEVQGWNARGERLELQVI